MKTELKTNGGSDDSTCSASSEYDRLKARKDMLVAAENAAITKTLRDENERLRSLLAQAIAAMPESVREATNEDLIAAFMDAGTEDVIRDTAQFILEARRELSQPNDTAHTQKGRERGPNNTQD